MTNAKHNIVNIEACLLKKHLELQKREFEILQMTNPFASHIANMQIIKHSELITALGVSSQIPKSLTLPTLEHASILDNALSEYNAAISVFKQSKEIAEAFTIPTHLSNLCIHNQTQHLDKFFSELKMVQRAFNNNMASSNIGQLIEPFFASSELYRNWAQHPAEKQITQIHIATPIREQFITAQLIESTAPREFDSGAAERESNTALEIDQYLGLTLPDAINNVDTRLFDIWKGAWGAFNSNNPDRIRHTLTSARELVTRIIHTLAPDEKLERWSTKPEHRPDGKWTREARLQFAISTVNDRNLTAFLQAELASWLKLIRVFNEATHSISPNLSDLQLKIILRKTHSLICTLFEIHETR